MFAVMTAVIGAFPEGENEFPPEWQTRRIRSLNQKAVPPSWAEFEVSGKKSGNNKFLFKVQHPGGWDVEGEWDVTKPPPWPDNESMKGWTVDGTSSAPVLGEARKIARK
jgi:hypothetical protein